MLDDSALAALRAAFSVFRSLEVTDLPFQSELTIRARNGVRAAAWRSDSLSYLSDGGEGGVTTPKESWVKRTGRWYGRLSKVDQAIALISVLVIGFVFLMISFELFGARADAIPGILLVGVVGLVYFIPSMVAASRNTSNKNSVFVINLFLGWTFIGWVVAMAMAVSQAETKKSGTVGQLDISNEKPRSTVVTTDIRQCPFCAEDIKKAAVVCKHCGRDVEPVS